jgi:phosphoenolpyruvate carboxykinase (GTP)
MGERLGDKAPAVFYVNWFRKNREGRWLWPGFGENSRVMKWMCERVEGKVGAVETPIGYMPKKGDLDLNGLNIAPEDYEELMQVNREAFQSDLKDAEAYFSQFGDRMPEKMKRQLSAAKKRLE